MTTPPLIDELARRAASGDHAAKAAIYYAYAQRLQRYAELHLPAEVRRWWSVSDVASEVLARAFAAMENKEFLDGDPEAFEKWLFVIARNHVLDLINKGGKYKPARISRAPGLTSSMGTVLGIIPASAESPMSEARVRERDLLLESAIETLPEQQRQVLVMRYHEGRDWNDIAALNGASVEAVRSSARRAIATLRATLGSTSNFLTT